MHLFCFRHQMGPLVWKRRWICLWGVPLTFITVMHTGIPRPTHALQLLAGRMNLKQGVNRSRPASFWFTPRQLTVQMACWIERILTGDWHGSWVHEPTMPKLSWKLSICYVLWRVTDSIQNTGQAVQILPADTHGDLRNHFPETYWDLVQNEEQVSSFKCMWRHQAAWPGLITDANAA